MIVRVSRDKHRVTTCTLVAADSLANPDRVEYNVLLSITSMCAEQVILLAIHVLIQLVQFPTIESLALFMC